MRSISELNSRESSLKSTLKKGYVKIFLVFVIVIIVGFIIRSWTSWIPEPDWVDPIYDDWEYLMIWLITLAMLLQNIGIALFTFATFLGAISDRNLSKEVRTGLAIASGLGIIALIIFGGSFQIVFFV